MQPNTLNGFNTLRISAYRNSDYIWVFDHPEYSINSQLLTGGFDAVIDHLMGDLTITECKLKLRDFFPFDDSVELSHPDAWVFTLSSLGISVDCSEWMPKYMSDGVLCCTVYVALDN